MMGIATRRYVDERSACRTAEERKTGPVVQRTRCFCSPSLADGPILYLLVTPLCSAQVKSVLGEKLIDENAQLFLECDALGSILSDVSHWRQDAVHTPHRRVRLLSCRVSSSAFRQPTERLASAGDAPADGFLRGGCRERLAPRDIVLEAGARRLGGREREEERYSAPFLPCLLRCGGALTRSSRRGGSTTTPPARCSKARRRFSLARRAPALLSGPAWGRLRQERACAAVRHWGLCVSRPPFSDPPLSPRRGPAARGKCEAVHRRAGRGDVAPGCARQPPRTRTHPTRPAVPAIRSPAAEQAA